MAEPINHMTQDHRGLFTRFLPNLWVTPKQEAGGRGRDDVHAGIVGAVVNSLSQTNTEMVESKAQSLLATATGDFLTSWGEMVGLPRMSADENDDHYRRRIIKYIAVKRGTIPAIIDALQDYFRHRGEDTNIFIYEPFRDIFYLNDSALDSHKFLQGSYYRYAIINIHISRPFSYEEMLEIVDRFKPAGVMVYFTFDPGTALDATIIDGLQKGFKVDWLKLSVEWMMGLKSQHNDTLFLGDSTKDFKATGLFYLNKSLLDSLDVLAGSVESGRESYNSVFKSKVNISVKPTDTVATLRKQGVEASKDMYTATKELDGRYGEADLASNDFLYEALDAVTFYAKNFPENRFDKAYRYIRVTTHEALSGVNFGGMSVSVEGGKVLHDGLKWYYRDTNGAVQTFANGTNITVHDRATTSLVLDLGQAYKIVNLKITQKYPTPLLIGYDLSVDSMNYAPIGDYLSTVDSITPLSMQDSKAQGIGYSEYLSHVFTTMTLSTSLKASVGNMVALDIYNVHTKSWTVVDTHIEEINMPSAVRRFSTKDVAYYINDNGIILTRYHFTEATTAKLDYFGVSFTSRLRQDIELDLRMKISYGESWSERYRSLVLALHFYPTLNLPELGSFPLGDVNMTFSGTPPAVGTKIGTMTFAMLDGSSITKDCLYASNGHYTIPGYYMNGDTVTANLNAPYKVTSMRVYYGADKDLPHTFSGANAKETIPVSTGYDYLTVISTFNLHDLLSGSEIPLSEIGNTKLKNLASAGMFPDETEGRFNTYRQELSIQNKKPTTTLGASVIFRETIITNITMTDSALSTDFHYMPSLNNHADLEGLLSGSTMNLTELKNVRLRDIAPKS